MLQLDHIEQSYMVALIRADLLLVCQSVLRALLSVFQKEHVEGNLNKTLRSTASGAMACRIAGSGKAHGLTPDCGKQHAQR